MFQVLKGLPCDIFLGAHGGYFDLEGKYARMKPGAPSPFIDRDGYQKFVSSKEQEFRGILAKQQGETAR
jgi:metallo-beta-lactamase class B